MAEKEDIIVIGGGPAGVVSVVTARRYYPNKKILLIRKVENGVVPCGIPYMFASLKNPGENRTGDAPFEKHNIGLLIDEVTNIDSKDKTVKTKTGKEYTYEKLILAIGSKPIIPPIPGIEKEGIYVIYKDFNYLNPVIDKIKRSKEVLIIGGGFIGIELADEISKIEGANVHIVEMSPRLLSNSFDPEFSEAAEKKLKEKGVNILVNTRVSEILGKDRVEGVKFSDGKEIKVDSVMLGIGAVPNTKIAQETGIDLGKGKGIWVDEYMRTSIPDIFAVGDCTGKRDFFTRRDVGVMLASTATAEARIAGTNLYKLQLVRENKGTIAIYSTYISGVVLGSAGLTENNAQKESFEIVTGVFEGVNKHPATLPGASRTRIKLVFSKQSGILLGGQAFGGISCGEIINTIGIAIQKRMSFTELETLQMATHPYLTSSPTMYPIVLAAQDASSKRIS